MNHSKQDNLEIETRSIINESVFCGRLDLVVNHASTHLLSSFKWNGCNNTLGNIVYSSA